jgi:hypothetical protein
MTPAFWGNDNTMENTMSNREQAIQEQVPEICTVA